jgi:antitoxin MazE
MRTTLQKIGNSQGIVIPKPLLAQLGIEKAVDLQIVGDHLEIRNVVSHARSGWSEALSALPESAFALTEEDCEWLASPAPRIRA